MGVEPTTPILQGSVAPTVHASPRFLLQRSVRELNPVFLLTEEVCCRNTYRPNLASDPGWNRTSTFLHVTQASSPLDHGIVLSMTRVGIEPTGARLSTSPLCQFAYPIVSGGSGSCTRRSRLMRPGWACAHPQVADPGIEPGDRPYGSQLGTCRVCNKSVTKGRLELPSPCGHDVLSVACLPVAPLGRVVSSPCGNRTRLFGVRGRCPIPIDERAMSSAPSRS